MAMTILVVDDSVTMVMSLKTTLAMNGFEVETANNGQAGARQVECGSQARSDPHRHQYAGHGGAGDDRQGARDAGLQIHPDSDADHGERGGQARRGQARSAPPAGW